MPKFSCACGHVINLSECPSASEYVLISEKRIDEIAKDVKNQCLTQENFYNLINESRTVVYVCFNCGRMHLERRRHNDEFATYVLEDELKSTHGDEGCHVQQFPDDIF